MEEREGAESIVREIKRKTRRRYNSEEKMRIVLEGLRGEDSIASLCKKEVTNLRDENTQLKYLVAEVSLRNRVLKKSN